MTNYNLFEGTPSVDSFDGPFVGGLSTNVGTNFYVTAPGWVTQIRHLQGRNEDNITWDQRVGVLWAVAPDGAAPQGIVAGPYTLPAPTVVGGWTAFDLPTPVALTVGQMYRIAVLYPTGGYPAKSAWFSGYEDYVFGIVTAPAAGNVPFNQQGSYKYTSYSSDMPDASYNATSYFSDVTITDVDPAAVKVSLKSSESGIWTPRSATPKVWNGTVWETVAPKRWNGSSWISL